ncbi:MAG: hypothetical protein KC486_01920 [Myxococcales bacterium]|nr:hypothetical protein [Myxococcales bacterium]
MNRTAAPLLFGAGLMLGFVPAACAPTGDAGECSSTRPCSERGEVCDTVAKLCVSADLDVDATDDPPATGSFSELMPFFRGKVCLPTKAKPGEKIPVTISPCVHPCVAASSFTQKHTWRCVGTSCEGLNLMWYQGTGADCPADVFGRFDASMCTYPLEIEAQQGPFTPSGNSVAGVVTTEFPFLTSDDIAQIDAGADSDEIWNIVNAYPADDERVIDINLSDANASAPDNCVDDPSACDCFNIGL